jgi:hypothetical protein
MDPFGASTSFKPLVLAPLFHHGNKPQKQSIIVFTSIGF